MSFYGLAARLKPCPSKTYPCGERCQKQEGQALRPALDLFCEYYYFLAGCLLWVVVVPERTERWLCDCFAISAVRLIEVTMKMMAHHVVVRVSRLAAERGPKAVCEPWPPKAPARS